jgi:chloramphenicol 3-O phosphotransferase
MGKGVNEVSPIGRVVLFNGPPSSGKTTLVRSLIASIGEPWFHLSLDEFRSGFADEWWVTDDGRLFDQVMAGYLTSIRGMALSGSDILAEAVITPARRALYEFSFGTTPIVLIGVHCPLEVAMQREGSRTDRLRGPIDLSPADFAAVHTGLIYDFEIDTSTAAAEELATRLTSVVRSITPSSFASHLLQ